MSGMFGVDDTTTQTHDFNGDISSWIVLIKESGEFGIT